MFDESLAKWKVNCLVFPDELRLSAVIFNLLIELNFPHQFSTKF
jgi:hypothetical protein